ncbi:MAG: polyphosphate--nucleotide phosphotransferase [Burkholderiaceae bacterium]|nr:polyphosphate--nucleotide phosphotransferase [Burkholderiaceae bacterium]
MPDTVSTNALFSARDKATAQRWTQWQPGTARPPGEPAKGKAFALDTLDPGEKPFTGGSKTQDKDAVEALAIELDALQNLFYADKRYKLLVVLQGTDTSGKDGTIRGVFGRMSALGVKTVGWKAPTEPELAHDYLWRIHQQVPQAGDITVFNRSHYEDVLVPVVNGWITPEQHLQRLAHINDFERMLSETGTIVLKFLLHISFDEQRERLQERLDDPAKHWKFSMGDIEVRKQWAEYRGAYNTLLNATHTPWAPWTIVPANSKTHRNLMIATVLREVLQNLDLRYPTGDEALKHFTVE